MNENCASEVFDLAIIGGGVNGCGIARDAAGRGLKVVLFEQGDLGQATSSASTKLFHGGLRYLEHFEFRLVREALIEREVLLGAMPHISWPLSFVLPHHKGLRPAWLLRLGLFFYDHLGGRRILPASRSLDLRTDPAGSPLKSTYVKGFEYPDCWVDDSRLVVLNARDAASHGADIRVRTRFEGARRGDDGWTINTTSQGGVSGQLQARVLINAGGPWVDEILTGRVRLNSPGSVRLVRGSHIVVRKLFDHDRAYIFQNSDGRVVFAIPYEDDYTLIGTTDEDHEGNPADAVCTQAEAAYLCAAVSEYFSTPVSSAGIVWTYSGVRPLYDDGASSATEATRDYVLDLNVQGGGGEAGAAPLLNVFGGKITTYRRLAEAALTKLGPFLPDHAGPWTRDASLPGGDMEVGGAGALAADLCAGYPFIDEPWACRLARTYGTDAARMLGAAARPGDLGQAFGATLTEREVDWLIGHEWARTADDVLWRRTKLGIRFTADETAGLDKWMRQQLVAGTAKPEQLTGDGPGMQ